MSAELEIHIDTMQQAWDDYCQFCYSLGFEPQQPDFAFSRQTRQQIWKRDHGQSVLSGETENLECAHIDHDKNNPRYDDASNGRLLTTEEHLQDHINRHGRNGLSIQQNIGAINLIKKRINNE